MTRRLIIGARPTTDGLFLSKPGFDALTASDANLLFSVNSDAQQMIMIGRVSGLPQTVTLGLTQRPFVLLNTQTPDDASGDARGALQEVEMIQNAYWRPFPFDNYGGYNSSVNVGLASMTINGSNTNPRTYLVFRRRFN
jgi:hypothetical protein